jgi:hypothetical protein
MPEYVVMFPADNEADWEARTPDERQNIFDIDYEFGQRLAKHGGAVTGGKGLTASTQARTLTRGPDSQAIVRKGPAAQAVEQLSGFFIVTCDDYDTLIEAAEVLVHAHAVVEIRPVKQF